MAYDIIGSREKAVVILDKKTNVLPEEIFRRHKNVKSILLKLSPRKGSSRTYRLKLIAGEKDTEVIHKEHGFKFLLDPRKVYFSPREATERLRAYELVKPREVVMVFFAGIGPLAIYVAKKAKQVIGIEKNPFAVKYFKENLKLNNIKNVKVVYGDVKEKAKLFKHSCSRVFMPLPEKAMKYLKYAYLCLKSKGYIHVYFFAHEDELEKIKKRLEKRKNTKIVNIIKVSPYATKTWKYRADLYIA